MSVSAIGASSTPAISLPSQASASSVKNAKGDYNAPSAQSSQVKDSDGDYKPMATSSSPVAASSSGVQTALSLLSLGG